MPFSSVKYFTMFLTTTEVEAETMPLSRWPRLREGRWRCAPVVVSQSLTSAPRACQGFLGNSFMAKKSRKPSSCPTCGHTVCPTCGDVYYVKPMTYCAAHPWRTPRTGGSWWPVTGAATTTGTYTSPFIFVNSNATGSFQLNTAQPNDLWLNSAYTNTDSSFSVTFGNSQ